MATSSRLSEKDCQEIVKEYLAGDLAYAEFQAWDSLRRYNFTLFGHWAAIWVHLNRAGHFKRPNPFTEAVALAKGKLRVMEENRGD